MFNSLEILHSFSRFACNLGSFNNYVDQILPNFDHPPSSKDNFRYFTKYIASMDYLMTTYRPTSSYPRSYWIPPWVNWPHLSLTCAVRGHSITTWTRWGGEGVKKCLFCPHSEYKNCPCRVVGGQKLSKFCPRSCWMPPKQAQLIALAKFRKTTLGRRRKKKYYTAINFRVEQWTLLNKRVSVLRHLILQLPISSSA